MDDLQALYQQVILDHNKNPRHFGVLEGQDVLTHQCYNRLCGDQIDVSVEVVEGMIERLAFTGKGCAICVASASLMCDHMMGRSIHDVANVFPWFLDLVKNGASDDDRFQDYAKLQVFKGVGAFPMRVKCATCAWHSLLGAVGLKNEEEI